MKISTRRNSAVGLVSAGTLGVLVVIGMFAMLYRLVAVPFDPTTSHQPLPLEFSDVKPPSLPPVEPPPPEESEPEPTSGVTPITDLVDTGSSDIDRPGRPDGVDIYIPVGPTTGPGGFGISPVGNDQDATPTVRIQPIYPASAEIRGIEGWVRVQFTITSTGAVRDARVVAANPGRVFDESALRAIERWRYSPRIVDGVAVDRVGVETLIEFQLTE